MGQEKRTGELKIQTTFQLETMTSKDALGDVGLDEMLKICYEGT